MTIFISDMPPKLVDSSGMYRNVKDEVLSNAKLCGECDTLMEYRENDNLSNATLQLDCLTWSKGLDRWQQTATTLWAVCHASTALQVLV